MLYTEFRKIYIAELDKTGGRPAFTSGIDSNAAIRLFYLFVFSKIATFSRALNSYNNKNIGKQILLLLPV